MSKNTRTKRRGKALPTGKALRTAREMEAIAAYLANTTNSKQGA